MSAIKFYQKMDCINNGKQKKILEDAGHKVESINILESKWTKPLLEKFFVGKEIKDCFNYTAPAVKKGEIDPEKLGRAEALEMMIANPIFIKRPLVEVDGLFIQGFNDPRLEKYKGSWAANEDVVTCPNLKANKNCSGTK